MIGRMGRRLGTGVLIGVVLAVVALVAAVPLLVVYRSTCQADGAEATRYSLVPPWEEAPSRCTDHQRGIEVLAEEVGL